MLIVPHTHAHARTHTLQTRVLLVMGWQHGKKVNNRSVCRRDVGFQFWLKRRKWRWMPDRERKRVPITIAIGKNKHVLLFHLFIFFILLSWPFSISTSTCFLTENLSSTWWWRQQRLTPLRQPPHLWSSMENLTHCMAQCLKVMARNVHVWKVIPHMCFGNGKWTLCRKRLDKQRSYTRRLWPQSILHGWRKCFHPVKRLEQ